MRPPGLRRSMAVFGGLLLLVALVTSLALVGLTTVQRRETASVGTADARMRASLRTKVALLWYARASDAAVSDASKAASTEQGEAEAELRSALAETRRLEPPQRGAQLDNLTATGQSYISLRDRLDAERLPLGLVIERSTPSLEAVFRDLEQLIASDNAWAQSVQLDAQRWDALANVLGISAAVLLLLGFAVAFTGTRLLVERPIMALTDAMVRFARGEEQSRSVPRGARELREMTKAFNEMADRLVRQSKDRLAFLSGVAHDLRNPLAALRLATDSALRGRQRASPEKAFRTLDLTGRQVNRLDRMVGDLLDATRIEAGHLELRLETADLRVLVAHVVELFRPVTTTHEIVVQVPEEPLPVECDPTRVEQVLINFVSNAIKYSPRGGDVVLRASTEGTEGVVAVSDQGIGIAEDERERIFEPFHRAGPSRSLVSGVGLGLSVARKIVEAHGGRIEVDSEVGHGSTFQVRLRLHSM